MVFDRGNGLAKFILKPTYSQFVDLTLLKLFINRPTLNETERIPDLIAEIPALLDL